MGDIGTHAENLAEYITGLQIESLCADIQYPGTGRLLDDDGNVLLRMNNGAMWNSVCKSNLRRRRK